jgi:hypothetical protein
MTSRPKYIYTFDMTGYMANEAQRMFRSRDAFSFDLQQQAGGAPAVQIPASFVEREIQLCRTGTFYRHDM